MELSRMSKVSGVYRIDNIITGDFFIAGSKDIRQSIWQQKVPSNRKKFPNSQMYKDMQKYGIENFTFTVIQEVEPDRIAEVKQKLIYELHPTYNNYNAKGHNIERRKATLREYDRRHPQFKSERVKKHWTTEKGKKSNAKHCKKYLSQKCFYEGEYITLNALAQKLRRAGFSSPYKEARKYVVAEK